MLIRDSHQGFHCLGHCFGGHRHTVGEPVLEQADAARAHEGVVHVDLLLRGLGEAPRIRFRVLFTADLK